MPSSLDQPALWNVPVRLDEVPETGRHVALAADAATRAAIAAHAGLRTLDRLEVVFDLSRRGTDGLHVTGEVSADVGQVCVVSLEPVDNKVIEQIDLDFLPAGAMEHTRTLSDTVDDGGEEPPELLQNGAVDLGALAVEFLILGLEPYPRKPGVEFVGPQDENGVSGPFAALAKLKTGPKSQN